MVRGARISVLNTSQELHTERGVIPSRLMPGGPAPVTVLEYACLNAQVLDKVGIARYQ